MTPPTWRRQSREAKRGDGGGRKSAGAPQRRTVLLAKTALERFPFHIYLYSTSSMSVCAACIQGKEKTYVVRKLCTVFI